MLLAGALTTVVCGASWSADVTPVDKEIGAEEVLRLVNSDYPGLDELAAAMAAGHLAWAQEMLVRHFATRAAVGSAGAIPGRRRGQLDDRAQRPRRGPGHSGREVAQPHLH